MSSMKRALWSDLLDWKKSAHRKPLILQGARQVGKTHLLKALGRLAFSHTVYLNFEETPSAKTLFDGDLVPERIIRDLKLWLGNHIQHEDTLIIFDEIQECPAALTSLKYFGEHAPQYYIVAAGSLLGVKLSGTHGFPVGKVNLLTLYPCSFFEFLQAMDKAGLYEYLQCISKKEVISEAIHLELLNLLKTYFFVGGMPEAVYRYSQTLDMIEVRKIQTDIVNTYLMDFSKHAPAQEIVKITSIWRNIPSQLSKENKKFVLSLLENKARWRKYEAPVQWLQDAGLVHASHRITVPRWPLDSYWDNHVFKLFLMDVGLLGAMVQMPSKILMEGSLLFTEFKGALTENFVAQELKANFGTSLYYWSSAGEAEVDFIVPFDTIIYPVEVKSGTNVKHKSLSIYRNKYHPSQAVRLSLLNLKSEADFLNCPLYLLARLKFFLSEHSG